jgi:hypothetical protein
MTIKRRRLFLTLGFLRLLRKSHALEQVDEKADWLQKASVGFSMMYYLGEIQSEAEVRLREEIDPFTGERTGRKAPTGFMGSLTPEGIDVAALVARAGERSDVANELLERFLDALLVPDTSTLGMMCYRPHHVIVCYTARGIPVAALEVCLECFNWNSLPHISIGASGDYLAVAKLIDSLEIPLGPDFPTLKSYEKRCAERNHGSK